MGNTTSFSVSIYEQLFTMTEQLCQRYPGLTPFTVRKERASEVFLIIKRINSKGNKQVSIQQRSSIIQKPKRVKVDEYSATGGWY